HQRYQITPQFVFQLSGNPSMRVLVANIPLPQNRFLVDLNQQIARQTQLTHDEKLFWNCQGEYDVVHLHFPEYLTFQHEEQYVRGLSDELITQTE
ncbi:MAG: hypothetical protein ACKPHU_14690, partial [Planctomycetaceae bacterium]